MNQYTDDFQKMLFTDSVHRQSLEEERGKKERFENSRRQREELIAQRLERHDPNLIYEFTENKYDRNNAHTAFFFENTESWLDKEAEISKYIPRCSTPKEDAKRGEWDIPYLSIEPFTLRQANLLIGDQDHQDIRQYVQEQGLYQF